MEGQGGTLASVPDPASPRRPTGQRCLGHPALGFRLRLQPGAGLCIGQLRRQQEQPPPRSARTEGEAWRGFSSAARARGEREAVLTAATKRPVATPRNGPLGRDGGLRGATRPPSPKPPNPPVFVGLDFQAGVLGRHDARHPVGPEPFRGEGGTSFAGSSLHPWRLRQRDGDRASPALRVASRLLPRLHRGQSHGSRRFASYAAPGCEVLCLGSAKGISHAVRKAPAGHRLASSTRTIRRAHKPPRARPLDGRRTGPRRRSARRIGTSHDQSDRRESRDHGPGRDRPATSAQRRREQLPADWRKAGAIRREKEPPACAAVRSRGEPRATCRPVPFQARRSRRYTFKEYRSFAFFLSHRCYHHASSRCSPRKKRPPTTPREKAAPGRVSRDATPRSGPDRRNSDPR